MSPPYAVPLVCLIFGTAAGYLVGRMNGPQTAVPSPMVQQHQDVARGAFVGGKGENLVAGGSVQQSLNALANDYSSKRASHLVDGLSLEQIMTGLKHLDDKGDDGENAALRAKLYAAWARIDSHAAWEAALLEQTSGARSSALRAVAGELAKSNHQAAIKRALSLGLDPSRGNVLVGVMGEWAKVNPTAAIAYLNSNHDLPIESYALSGAFAELAKENPEKFAAQALSVNVGNSRQNALYNLFGHWRKKDYEGAKRWAENIENPLLRDEALVALFSGGELAEDPLAALKNLELIESVDSRQNAQSNILSSWMRQDPMAAMDYLTNEGSGLMEKSASLFGNSLRNMTTQEREDLLARMPEGKSKESLVGSMASSMIYNDRYAQAISTLNTMADSPQRDHHLHSLGQQWGKKDPEAVAEWINAQADSSDRDMAVAGYASAVAVRDPQSALQWVSSIPDSKVQKTAYRNIVDRWLSVDVGAAQQWLNASPLFNQNEKNSIMENYSRSGGGQSTYMPSVSNRR